DLGGSHLDKGSEAGVRLGHDGRGDHRIPRRRPHSEADGRALTQKQPVPQDPRYPVTTETSTPKISPVAPPTARERRSMPAPRAKAKKGMVMDAVGSIILANRSSRLPRMKPMMKGTMAATRACQGIAPRPLKPRKSRVKKGPSFRALAMYAPRSSSSPYWEAKAIQRPPLELMKATMNASREIPRMPSRPNR